MKRVWGLMASVCLLAAIVAGPARAGTVYRCEGDDGTRSYVSKRIPGAKCAAVSTQPPARPSVRAPAAIDRDSIGVPSSANHHPPATFMGGSAAAAAVVAAAAPSAPSTPRPSTASQGTRRLQQGQVYSYVKDGVRHYTSARPAGDSGASGVRTIQYSFFETCFACGSLPGVNFGSIRLNTSAFQTEIREAAHRHGVEEAVVRAIMHAESAYNPNALSRAGAQGLMQLMPATARRFGVINPFDPGQNINGGVEYLAWLLKRFKGDLTLASAGYNAGEGAVDRHKGVPPYSETQRYVQRVAVLAERYRGHLASN